MNRQITAMLTRRVNFSHDRRIYIYIHTCMFVRSIIGTRVLIFDRFPVILMHMLINALFNTVKFKAKEEQRFIFLDRVGVY